MKIQQNFKIKILNFFNKKRESNNKKINFDTIILQIAILKHEVETLKLKIVKQQLQMSYNKRLKI
jgi:hypothetical protein